MASCSSRLEVHGTATPVGRRQAGAGQSKRHAVIGQHRHAPGIVADQRDEAPSQFDGRTAVEGQGDDAFGGNTPHPEQVGDAVHDDACLAGAGPGEHQVVAVLRHLDEPLLHRVLQIVDDAPEGHVGGRQVQQVGAALEPLPHEAPPRQREVGVHEQAGLVGVLGAQPGVLVHHVGLQRSFAIEVLQRREVVLGEAPLALPPGRSGSSSPSGTPSAPCRVRATRFSCMYSSACSSAAAGSRKVALEVQVGVDGVQQVPGLALDDEAGLPRAGGQLGQQPGQHHLRHRAAPLADRPDLRPGRAGRRAGCRGRWPWICSMLRFSVPEPKFSARDRRQVRSDLRADPRIAVRQLQPAAQLGAQRPDRQVLLARRPRRRRARARTSGPAVRAPADRDRAGRCSELRPAALGQPDGQAEVIDQDAQFFQLVQDPKALVGRDAGIEHQLVGADALGAQAAKQRRRDGRVALRVPLRADPRPRSAAVPPPASAREGSPGTPGCCSRCASGSRCAPARRSRW